MERPICFLEGEDLPKWTKGLASFQKSNILKHESLSKTLGLFKVY
jgi:hypothetical protein